MATNTTALRDIQWGDPEAATRQIHALQQQNGWSNDDIAQQYNRDQGAQNWSANDVSSAYTKYGLGAPPPAAPTYAPPRPQDGPLKTVYKASNGTDVASVLRAYDTGGYTTARAAAEFGIPEADVRAWLSKNGRNTPAPIVAGGGFSTGGGGQGYSPATSRPYAGGSTSIISGVTTPAPAEPAPLTPSTASSGMPSSSSISTSQQARQLGTPTPWTVDPSQTVEGRIASIINPNNPIVQQAQAQAKIAAAERGLSNTSMAVTAGQAAAYQAALPIAHADAQTFAKAAGYNADQTNQFASRNVDASNTFSLADKNIGAQANLTDKNIAGQAAITDKNIAGQRDLAGINRDTQLQVGRMNIDAQATANKLEQANKTLISTNGSAATAFNQAVAAVNQINMNDKMDASTKARGVAEVWTTVHAQLKVLGAVAGLNLTGMLANVPGFDEQGSWIGFPEPTPAPGTTNQPVVGGGPDQGGGTV